MFSVIYEIIINYLRVSDPKIRPKISTNMFTKRFLFEVRTGRANCTKWQNLSVCFHSKNANSIKTIEYKSYFYCNFISATASEKDDCISVQAK